MVSYYADPSGMLDSSSELTAVTNMLEQDIRDLERAANAFLQANRGAAIDGYQAAQQQWQAAIERMRASLARTGPQLENMVANYTRVDQQGAAMLSR